MAALIAFRILRLLAYFLLSYRRSNTNANIPLSNFRIFILECFPSLGDKRLLGAWRDFCVLCKNI